MGAQANVRLAAESQDLLIVTLKVRLISAFYRNLILSSHSSLCKVPQGKVALDLSDDSKQALLSVILALCSKREPAD